MSEQLSVESLHKGLNEKGYICDVDFASRVATSMIAKPTGGAFLYGPAGTGKSYLPHVLSDVLNRKMFFHQCSAGTREDDLLMRIFPSEDTRSGVEILYGKVYQAVIASNTEKVVLVLDEWDKTRPSADGYMLDFLQYGRLSIPGEEIKANLDNLMIFFTANDERDFSEALLRRFPKIDMEPLHPKLVRKALENTHDKHANIPNAISLYQRCLIADMPKPATIQELRQLLDAIDFLGQGSDWNELVYQYITKTAENHELLADAEGKDIEDIYASSNGVKKLNSSAYENCNEVDDENDIERFMPKLYKFQKFNTDIDDSGELPEGESIYGVFKKSNRSYDAVVQMTREIADDAKFPKWSSVIGDTIIMDKPIDVHNYVSFNNLVEEKENSDRDIDGEVMLKYEECSREEARRLVFRKYEVHKSSKDEIIARKYFNHQSDRYVDLRWTHEDGLCVIVPVGSNGIRNIIPLFKINKHYNVLGKEFNGVSPGIVDVSKITSYLLTTLDNGNAVSDLGTAMIKRLSKHNGFCDMSICSTFYKHGHDGFEEASGDLLKSINFNEFDGGYVMSGSGIVLEVGNAGSETGKAYAKLYVDSMPNIKLFYYALKGLGRIPFYSCFKADIKEVSSKLSNRSWSYRKSIMISPDSRFMMIESFGYICFIRVFKHDNYYSDDSDELKSDVRNAINELRKFRRRFEQD